MSNIDIIRTITAELAARTKVQVTGWRWADGVVVFPDIRCPYCKVGVRSPAIWKHTDTMLIGQVVPEVGVTPKLERPKHAHVTTEAGGICFGKARTAYQALFGALNGTAQYRYVVQPFLQGSLMGNHHCDEMNAEVEDESIFICHRCGGEYDEDNAYWYDDEQYCGECFNEVAFSCYNCGDACSVDERNTGTDDYDYCSDCWRARFFSCEKCGDTGRKDGGRYDTPDGDYCEDCYGDNYFGCERCGDTTGNDDKAAYDEESICQTCFDANFTKCEDCDEVYANKGDHDCPEAEADDEAEANDYDEDTLNAADELVRKAIEEDPENELLERVHKHTFNRYVAAPPMKEKE